MKWQDKYEPVIGLEIHAELKTKSKMFCGCVNNPFGADQPNSHTCPVCLGMPGGIPVPNKKAIEWTVKIGLATHCKINQFSKFDRKHYFYPDLAKGYQISQYGLPFCYNGKVETSEGMIGLTRVHLEEDTGKLQHKVIDGEKISLIDFNRGGVPLVELVTEPDIRSASQAKEYAKKIRQLLRFLDVSDADMEQGGMRLEANISLRKKGETNLPSYKTEVKNINSFRFMEQAINFELDRQSEILENGETPIQETRGWDSINNKTFPQRTKEDSEDYRYFPDPDIPPIRLSDELMTEIKNSLPKMPEEVAKEWIKLGLSEKNAKTLTKTDSQKTLHWLEEILNLLKENNLDLNKFASDFINGKLKINQKQTSAEVVEKFKAINTTDEIDPAKLQKTIAKILAENPEAVEKYKAGKTQVIGFLMGQTMKALGGKADPKVVSSALREAMLS